jgi:hypothetical protein
VLTSSEELASVLQQEAEKLTGGLGGGPSDVQGFVTEFHDYERAQQIAQSRGQTSYTADPVAQADAYLREHDQQQIIEYTNDQNVANLGNMMRVPGEGPSTTACQMLSTYCP